MTDIPRTLEGRTAVITGGGSGIGQAAAVLLAKAGASVALIGRTSDELIQSIERMEGGGNRHFAVNADVASEIEMIAAYESVANHWDRLDIVVANAGVNGVWAPLDQLEVREWDQTMGINLRGTFLTVKLALPLLRKRGGSVIVISSINGTRAIHPQSVHPAMWRVSRLAQKGHPEGREAVARGLRRRRRTGRGRFPPRDRTTHRSNPSQSCTTSSTSSEPSSSSW